MFHGYVLFVQLKMNQRADLAHVDRQNWTDFHLRFCCLKKLGRVAFVFLLNSSGLIAEGGIQPGGIARQHRGAD